MSIFPALSIDPKIPLDVQPVDMLGPALKYAQTQNTQANTANLAQQTQNLGLTNQQGQISLNLLKSYLDQAGMPNGQAGAGGVPGAPGAPGAGTSVGPGSNALLALADPARAKAIAEVQKTNIQAQQDRAALGATRNLQAITSVNDQQSWQSALAQQHANGDIDDMTYQRYIQQPYTPDLKTGLLSAFVPVDKKFEELGYDLKEGTRLVQQSDGTFKKIPIQDAAQTQATIAAAQPYNIGPDDTRMVNGAPVASGAKRIEKTNSDGTTTSVAVTPSVVTGAAAAPARAGDIASPPQTMGLPDYAAKVQGLENGSGAPDAKNPNSSATGNGQFIDSTWLNQIKTSRPDLAAGKSDAQLLAMRSNPALSSQMTGALAQQNAPVLQQAGFQPNASTLYMAHRLGATGAVSVMSAAPDAPLASILSSDVMKANPDLAGQTAGGLVKKVVDTMGRTPVSLTPAPGQGGEVPGSSIPTSISPAAHALQTGSVAELLKYQGDQTTKAQTAQGSNTLIDQMKQERDGWVSGPQAPSINSATAYAVGLAKQVGMDPGVFEQNVGNWQAFNKNAAQLARTAASNLSPNVGVQELSQVTKSLPTDVMSSVGFQRVADQLQGLNDYQIFKQQQSANWTGNPNQFESSFNQKVTPLPFIVQRMSTEDYAKFAGDLNKTPAGKAQLAKIVSGLQYVNQATPPTGAP